MTTRIGLLGGTFDPPHYAHLILGQHALEELELDYVLFIPAGQPVHKSQRTPLEHRVNMLRLAIAQNDRFQLSRVEIDRPGPHYSVDTIRIIQQYNPQAELFFIMGGDVYRDLPNWERPREMFYNARLAVAVMRRPGFGQSPDLRLDMHHNAIPELEQYSLLLNSPLVEFSSTDIVERLSNGRSVRYMVPDHVLEYIKKHKLYEEDDE
jgi:nicotinate-nucleotide adenylyltransferase